MESPSLVPKTIYSLWLQGRDRAPDTVKRNFDLWSRLNPGYVLRVLEGADVERRLVDLSIQLESMTSQAISDVVRARILKESGGIWTDASVLPTKPLDEWLPSVTAGCGFFAFHRPAPDRLISSWFLVSTPAHPLVNLWWSEIERFWSTPRRRSSAADPIPEDPITRVAPGLSAQTDDCPYFWFHYLFEYLVTTDQEAASLWERCPKVSAIGAHAVQDLLLANPNPKRGEVLAAARGASVQKLDWRRECPPELFDAIANRRPRFTDRLRAFFGG